MPFAAQGSRDGCGAGRELESAKIERAGPGAEIRPGRIVPAPGLAPRACALLSGPAREDRGAHGSVRAGEARGGGPGRVFGALALTRG